MVTVLVLNRTGIKLTLAITYINGKISWEKYRYLDETQPWLSKDTMVTKLQFGCFFSEIKKLKYKIVN
jgi:hypothetical protein